MKISDALSPKKHRILYLEDHVDTVEMVALLLAPRGFDVTSCSTVEAALTIVAQDSFDLYLLDSWLPDGSGLEFCRRIRLMDSRTPVVFYSAAGYQRDIDDALGSGAQAYLVKPTDSNDLCDLLLHFIEVAKPDYH